MRRLRPLALRTSLVVATLASGAFAPACLENPGVGRAADPARAPGPAPWGSSTSNADMDKKRALLEEVLDGTLSAEAIAVRVEKDWPELTPDQRKEAIAGIASLLQDLAKAGKAGKAIPEGADRNFARGQLYFSERRFIEAAGFLSSTLDDNPTYPQARNLLARCFFFLGNRDRTIVELEFILKHPEQGKDREEVLDALFLLGAAVAETPGMSRENLQKAKGAWETYVKLAPDSPQVEHIKKGMADLDAGLRGEGPLAQPLVPAEGDDGEQSPSPAPGPMGPATNPEHRAEKLPRDASPFERAVAEGLDALDVRDVATAEPKFTEALRLKANAPEALTGMARVYVQSGRIDQAKKLFADAIAANADYMPAWHYQGMAGLLSGSPADAVKSWETIEKKDPAYFAKFNLAQRLEVARRMAAGGP